MVSCHSTNTASIPLRLKFDRLPLAKIGVEVAWERPLTAPIKPSRKTGSNPSLASLVRYILQTCQLRMISSPVRTLLVKRFVNDGKMSVKTPTS